MPFENILALIAATLVLNASPGPDMIYVFGRTLSQGRLIGFISALGVCAGAFIHAMMAAIGLSAILVSSELLFNGVKIVGALYLIYLGIKVLRSKSNMLSDSDKDYKRGGLWAAFRQGMLTNILNPKVAIFFMAFLPQFLSEGGWPQTLQLTVLGLTVVLIAIITQTLLVTFAASLSKRVFSSAKNVALINRGFGTVLVAMGTKVVLSLR